MDSAWANSNLILVEAIYDEIVKAFTDRVQGKLASQSAVAANCGHGKITFAEDLAAQAMAMLL